MIIEKIKSEIDDYKKRNGKKPDFIIMSEATKIRIIQESLVFRGVNLINDGDTVMGIMIAICNDKSDPMADILYVVGR